MENMYGKDDRSKDNRKNMKQHKYYNKQQQRGDNTSSSSPKTTAVRSIVDVADSSDEPRFTRKGWSSGTRGSLAPQKNRDMLDTLPPTDAGGDLLEIGVDGAPIDENARAQLRAGDYKQMSQFPSMGGGHFTFGAEKEWNNIAKGQTQLHTNAASSYFTLNLSLLNNGLQTIPFYKRMDYATSMFTRQQILAQNEAAEHAERCYHKRVLREQNGNQDDNKSDANSGKSLKDAQQPTAAATSAVAPPDELDELLALTNTQLNEVTLVPAAHTLPIASPAPSATKNDVEQWLDSVLDE